MIVLCAVCDEHNSSEVVVERRCAWAGAPQYLFPITVLKAVVRLREARNSVVRADVRAKTRDPFSDAVKLITNVVVISSGLLKRAGICHV